MNSLLSSTSLPILSSLPCRFHPVLQLQYHSPGCVSNHSLRYPSTASTSSCFRHPSRIASTPQPEGTVAVMNLEELMEKDWSFLETEAAHVQNVDRILSAGKIEPTSKVLVSFGSEGFVDRLVETLECQLLMVVHDSLFVLACIKEKYDKVKCWQGELINVPEKWAPLDVVFIYFLPALPFTLGQIFSALAKRCQPGSRVVISHPQGRSVLEQQRREFPDAVIADLPDEITLKNAAAEHSFGLVEFVDEPGLYLAVLQLNEP